MKPVVYLVRALPGDPFVGMEGLIELRGGGAQPEGRAAQILAARDAAVYVPTYIDRVDDGLLAALPALRLVASYGVGVDHIDLAACRARGIAVTNTPGVLVEATADHTFALLLTVARRVCEADRFVRAGRWQAIEPAQLLGTDVHGKTLGIIGFGHIGQAVARRALGFSMKVLYASPNEVSFPAPGISRVTLDVLLAESDFVSLHCPLTPTTRGLIGREQLRAMKRGAILVNTARGAVVDEAALVRALREGPLGGAGLDVFADEPRVLEDLRAQENVVLTPHIGSGSQESRGAMARLVAEEVARLATGQPLVHRMV
ncbi:MAG TPA: D-glycerate dehydrogenase [Polyangia bacterium]|jgi:glyoxylate reductase|nr:D-glycerate dehydrogenase [Polyangia bacterium]